jgi:hypothetical protein
MRLRGRGGENEKADALRLRTETPACLINTVEVNEY